MVSAARVAHPQEVVSALASCIVRWREERILRSDARYDILIDTRSATPVAVAISRCKTDADSRAANYLKTGVDTAIAVVVPTEWKTDSVISYAIHQTLLDNCRRFPDRGFIRGCICDLARLVQVTMPLSHLDTVERTVAGLVKQAANQIGNDTARLSGQSGPDSHMMTALLWLDGMLALTRQRDSNATDIHTLTTKWRSMIRDGKAPIFRPAVEVLEQMGESAVGAIAYIRKATNVILEAGLEHTVSVGAGLLPKISKDRKKAAEFYTRPPVAKMLADLVISKDDVPNWSDKDIFCRYKLADLACGTGTLLRAGFERIRMLHENGGGTGFTVSELHRDAVRSGIIGVDVYQAVAHMAASSLVSVVPQKWDGKTSIGWMGVGGRIGYTGSIELVKADRISDLDMSSRVAAGLAEHLPVSIPDQSCDWIIMNPPYSRTRIGRAAFDIAGLSTTERSKCQDRWRDLIRDEPARKTAGMAATYVVIAGKRSSLEVR